MTYLQHLKIQKESREQYELDSIKLKELVYKINEYHAIYDGKFLRSLENFLIDFEKVNDNPINHA